MEKQVEMPYTIYAENTPNPQSMKFVANKVLIESDPIEFTDSSSAGDSPFAQRLFQFPFVSSVFLSGNYVTINKTDAIDWQDIVMELRIMITEYLNEGNPVLTGTKATVKSQMEVREELAVETKDLSELDLKISDILNEYVRPAVEQDGGAIDFHSFNEGTVTVNLRGACSGCPSSTLTLKSGIETILKRLVPEVEEVVAVEL
ncbi:MAG: NifU family protein [Flavobacteriales bacterium]|nr:NifU family protein [Flavobacteriales bacterium]